jgi:hypothetical protein
MPGTWTSLSAGSGAFARSFRNVCAATAHWDETRNHRARFIKAFENNPHLPPQRMTPAVLQRSTRIASPPPTRPIPVDRARSDPMQLRVASNALGFI